MNKIVSAFTMLYRYLKYWYLLNSKDKLSEDKIAQYQFKKIKKLIDYAWNNVPFYREYWQKNNFTPDHFKGISDIVKIPTITKTDIIDNQLLFVSSKVDVKSLTNVKTGGTTGMPSSFYLDKSRAQIKEFVFVLNELKRAGVSLFSKLASFRGKRVDDSLIEKQIYWQKGNIFDGMIFSSFHLSDETIAIYHEELLRYKPTFIKAYPSAITVFCRLVKRHNLSKLPQLKGVICSSENLYTWQRNLVEEVLGVPVFSHYGHSEKAVFAGECEVSNKMHFSPFYGYTEFLNAEGKACNDGEKGEVVVTGFDQEAFPFIRYKTNDFVECSTEKCKCNRNFKMANKILGRLSDFIVDKNGAYRVFTCSDEMFYGLENIINAYQYVQNIPGEIILRVEGSGITNGVLEQLESGWSKDFSDFAIRVEKVQSIERTAAGKFRYLIQNIELK